MSGSEVPCQICFPLEALPILALWTPGNFAFEFANIRVHDGMRVKERLVTENFLAILDHTSERVCSRVRHDIGRRLDNSRGLR